VIQPAGRGAWRPVLPVPMPSGVTHRAAATTSRGPVIAPQPTSADASGRLGTVPGVRRAPGPNRMERPVNLASDIGSPFADGDFCERVFSSRG